jgi:hypothetical protein
MPLDFPQNPNVGYEFTAPYGAIFVWDGVKWGPMSAVTAGSGYLPLTGGVMVGEITFVTPQDVSGPVY